MSTQSAVAGSAEPIQPTDSEIELRVYGGEQLLGEIMALISADLSEPYSIYTYRYFINNWPKLCFTAHCGSVCIGAIVCKLSHHKKGTYRGYIAMLAVHKDHRRKNIGSPYPDLFLDLSIFPTVLFLGCVLMFCSFLSRSRVCS
eukprot:m.142870 g.142870  ORF g.142870 m.142870 type:complete len:144 (-) comp52625_c0_seq4:280-711(-)